MNNKSEMRQYLQFNCSLLYIYATCALLTRQKVQETVIYEGELCIIIGFVTSENWMSEELVSRDTKFSRVV